jgi:hypothetical protein
VDDRRVDRRLRSGLEIAAIVLLVLSTMLEAQITFILAAILIVVVLLAEYLAHRTHPAA